jgi:hypothetical protein
LKSGGKQITQVLYNARTSSTKIKQNVMAQPYKYRNLEQAVA